MHDKISQRQLHALLLAAAMLPVFWFCCRWNWRWAALGGVGASLTLSLLYLYYGKRPLPDTQGLRGKILAGALALSLLTLAGWAGRLSAGAFPETEKSPVAACLILAAAAWAAWHGTAALGRCAGLLLPAALALYGIVLGFSAPQIQWEWLGKTGSTGDALSCYLYLLLPGAGVFLRRGVVPAGPRRLWVLWLPALLAVVAAIVTGGVLSPNLAREPHSFRALAKSVSILGVIQRFEALVYAAMLISGFCLCGLLLGAAKELLLGLAGQREGKRAFACLLPLPALLTGTEGNLPAKAAGAVALIAICSDILANVTQGVGKRKKFEKNEKKC